MTHRINKSPSRLEEVELKVEFTGGKFYVECPVCDGQLQYGYEAYHSAGCRAIDECLGDPWCPTYEKKKCEYCSSGFINYDVVLYCVFYDLKPKPGDRTWFREMVDSRLDPGGPLHQWNKLLEGEDVMYSTSNGVFVTRKSKNLRVEHQNLSIQKAEDSIRSTARASWVDFDRFNQTRYERLIFADKIANTPTARDLNYGIDRHPDFNFED